MNENKKNNPEAELNDEALDKISGGGMRRVTDHTPRSVYCSDCGKDVTPDDYGCCPNCGKQL